MAKNTLIAVAILGKNAKMFFENYEFHLLSFMDISIIWALKCASSKLQVKFSTGHRTGNEPEGCIWTILPVKNTQLLKWE